MAGYGSGTNFDVQDLTSMIPGAHVLFVILAMQAATFTFLGYDAGRTIEALSGVSLATVGVYTTFGAGWFVRRTRKRLDDIDKVGLALAGGVPLLTVIVQPLADLIYSDPVIGAVASLPVIGGYVAVVER